MTVKEFLSHVPNDELINRLKLIDQSLYELHQHGLFVACNIADIEIINNEVTLESFKNKVVYLNEGFNPNGDKKDILELCCIGVCAFNHFEHYYSSKEFMQYLMENSDKYINNGKLPRVMKEYYNDVFGKGNISYLNDYLLQNDIGDNKEMSGGDSRSKGMAKTKSTAVGRALAGTDKEAAYVKVLLLPALLAVTYLAILVTYMIFFR